MTFKRVQVKRGTTDGAYTAVTFMEPIEDGSEVVVGGAFYIMAMMNTSSGHRTLIASKLVVAAVLGALIGYPLDRRIERN
jgi:hypothetical protein